jgi:hypothetical protein
MKWFKQILGIFGEGNSVMIAEPSQILIQQDYYSIAWGLKHNGYYISSEGIKYSYDKPKQWNFYERLNHNGPKERSWGNDKISFIERNKLLKNLGVCKISYTKSKFDQDKLFYIIDELTNSELIETMVGGCDMGLHSTSLLVFDNLNNTYKRILLGCQGDFFLELKTDKKKIIYDLIK